MTTETVVVVAIVVWAVVSVLGLAAWALIRGGALEEQRDKARRDAAIRELNDQWERDL